MPVCDFPGCDYEAKTPGAITQHKNKAHADDKLGLIRGEILGAPRPGGAFTARPMKVQSTGVPSFDFATEVGGAPRGTIIEVFGESGSGKTLMALTFSALAQLKGGRAGYMDTERALQPTFLKIVKGLDAQALEYGWPPDYRRLQFENEEAIKQGAEPPYADSQIEKMKEAGYDGTGEAAFEVMRRYIETGMFDVFTLDSIFHATPRAALSLPIGHPQTRAALAQMLGQALQVIETSVANTDTLCILINHVRDRPDSKSYGRQWTKPGGKAVDYVASMQLHVRMGQIYVDSRKRRIGHRLSVKMYKSKVNAPNATGEFDVFYRTGTTTVKEGEKAVRREITETGVDLASSWLSVAKESGRMEWKGNRYWNPESGEVLGTGNEVREQIMDPGSPLRVELQPIVYPPQYQ